MTEAQIRKIVRDELQEEALKAGGVYDHCRTAAFNIVRQILTDHAQRLIAGYEAGSKASH